MFGISPLVLIILPLFFQIIFGRKAIAESITLEFGTISMISIILQIALTIIAFIIASTNFEEPVNHHGYRCGMGFIGIFMLSFLFSIILVIVIIVQYYIKKSYEE
ncbi:hypothetical protein [Flavobacterium pectinovorum]|uniref:Uncharacterized protein n=1 Tax=Flavobacterium pectinovorum TaxID=29533 RepID=A0A502E329_9FLAO|nr:hypothetical protein [Flavobacterium pectinovorum]TPG32105.1 hypothetical protein EAH81_26095 [Flavobacterium pectinovorum]